MIINPNNLIYGEEIDPELEPSLANGLVALWHLNGDALDSSGNDNTLSVTSATSAAGLWGTNAYEFDGVNDFITAEDSASLEPTNITLSTWFYPNGLQALDTHYVGLVKKEYDTSASSPFVSYGFVFNSTGDRLEAMISEGTPNGSPDFEINLNEWNHAVMTFDGSILRIYLNGEFIESASQSVIQYSNGKFIFGQSYGANVGRFDGKIDEVAIWNRALDSNEVIDLFSKGSSKIGVQARSCSTNDCSTSSWSEIQYGSNQFKYFSLPRNQFLQIKVTSELIPFEAKLVIPESCVSPYGADYWESCYSYFHDSSSCNAYSNHNGSCYWYEYGECYGDMGGYCYNQYDEYSCSSQNGCYWNYPYCYGDMWGYCYYNFWEESSCNSQNGCSWYNYYSGCEGDMWGYCYSNYTDEASCNAVSECSWGGDGCYSQTECYYFDYDSCQSHSQMCYWYEYGECSPTIDCYSQDQSSCYNYGGCYLEGNYCSANTECYYNYDRSSCESYPACSFNDYSYCEGGFRCEDQLNEGSSSCTAFGSGCNYTASVSTDYLSYFYNATPKLVDINILYYN